TVTDALYFAIVTSSTVGYGDAAPMPQSQSARLFTMSVVVLGTASFALALGTVLGPAIQSRISKALGTMTDTHLELLEDHVLVLGYGDLTEPILEELQGAVEFVVITPDPDKAAILQQRDIEVLTADPSDEDPLERAGLADAQAVVAATNDDARDALSILTANQLNPDIRIVAAATDRENVEKLRRAGADTVISPAAIGGHLIVQSALGQAGMEDIANHILGVESEEEAESPDI
ncbi:MAG: NAD-binding protein, partial [Haloarculaceae archaeon]